MILGILGARSKHLEFFSDALKHQFPHGDCRISHLWGQDAPERIDECCRHANITGLCSTPEQLICACDGVIVALRDGTQHAALGEACFMHGKPVFIDKPFTCSVEDAQHILDCAEAHAVSFTGGSTICFTPLVQDLAADMPKCDHYTLSYQADPFSPFGGWYFYGSHLTDLCTTLFGLDFYSVDATLTAGCVTALVKYPHFSVTLKSTPEPQPFILTADKSYIFDDSNCYKAGMEHFVAIVNGKAPSTGQRLFASVKLLNAVLSSLRAGVPISL